MALSHDKGPMSHDPNDAHILAITCVFGNTLLDNVTLNVLKVLRACGRLDVSINYLPKKKKRRKKKKKNYHDNSIRAWLAGFSEYKLILNLVAPPRDLINPSLCPRMS